MASDLAEGFKSQDWDCVYVCMCSSVLNRNRHFVLNGAVSRAVPSVCRLARLTANSLTWPTLPSHPSSAATATVTVMVVVVLNVLFVLYFVVAPRSALREEKGQ